MKFFKDANWVDIVLALFVILPLLSAVVLGVAFVFILPIAGLGLLAIFIPKVMISTGIILVALFIMSLWISMVVRSFFRNKKSPEIQG